MILKYLKGGPPLLSGSLRSSRGPDHAQQFPQLCTAHQLLCLLPASQLCPDSEPASSPLSLSLALNPRFVGTAVAWEAWEGGLGNWVVAGTSVVKQSGSGGS